MNRIERMLQELCPEEVEYKPLWQVTVWDKNFKGVDRSWQSRVISYPYVLANVFDEIEVEGGNVKLLGTGIIDNDRWTTEEKAGQNLCEGEIVAIPWGGTPNVKYYNGKFVTADNRIATSIDKTILSNKFLYYYLSSQINQIAKLYRGAGIQHPSMFGVLSFEIPVPPLPIQEEIVRILDHFTELTASLQAELQARQEQYEYYNNRLLSFDDDIPKMKLNDVVTFMNGKGHEKYIEDQGAYIVVNSKFISTAGKVIKYSNSQISPLYKDMILMVMSDLPNGKALAKCFVVDADNKYTLNQRIGAFTIRDKNLITTRFLYYILDRNKQLLSYDNGADQTNLRKGDILNIIIPVPPLSEQQRIVSILDKFETLVNDLSQGLPAEITAMQEQYEYYRNKLLTFNRSN